VTLLGTKKLVHKLQERTVLFMYDLQKKGFCQGQSQVNGCWKRSCYSEIWTHSIFFTIHLIHDTLRNKIVT